MDWKRERDLLVAQTLAFVQSVTGRKSGLEPDAEAAPIGAVDIEAIAAAIKTVEPPRRAKREPYPRRLVQELADDQLRPLKVRTRAVRLARTPE